MLQVPFYFTKLFENYYEQLSSHSCSQNYSLSNTNYMILCYQWTSLDIDTRNEKSGFGRKTKEWQDERVVYMSMHAFAMWLWWKITHPKIILS
jgi:hypothetical protein